MHRVTTKITHCSFEVVQTNSDVADGDATGSAAPSQALAKVLRVEFGSPTVRLEPRLATQCACMDRRTDAVLNTTVIRRGGCLS